MDELLAKIRLKVTATEYLDLQKASLKLKSDDERRALIKKLEEIR
jgi:hypothetical protein